LIKEVMSLQGFNEMVDTALRAGQDRNTINSLRALSLMSKHGAGRQQEETSRNFEWTNNVKEASCILVAYPVILTERGEILRNLTLKTGLTSICRNSGIVRPVSSSSSPGLQETSEPVGAGGEVARRVPLHITGISVCGKSPSRGVREDPSTIPPWLWVKTLATRELPNTDFRCDSRLPTIG
jgi:hypothetical protein